jgi:SAM-dependent methyltransferase
MADTPSNVFNDATAYERYVGRWSRVVAPSFVRWLGLPAGRSWLDVGAGTGVLTQAILDHAAPTRIVAVDLSAAYVDYARSAVTDPRVEFAVGDAARIADGTAEFDAAVAGLVLNFVPSPPEVVRGMTNAVVSGGTVAAYVWDYLGRMEMVRRFWDAAMAIDPAAGEYHAQTSYALCNPDALGELFDGAGLNAVESVPIDAPARFSDFDDLWTPFLGAQGSVARYLRSRDDDTRDAIRDRLRQLAPGEADGAIVLNARAWAVKGTKP